MDLYAEYGQVDKKNELWMKKQYDAITEANRQGYCLVALALKNFLEYSHCIGGAESENAIHTCFDLLASCLLEGESIVRVHSCYFLLLLKCAPELDDLHKRASEFHYVIRNAMEARYGLKLYLEMGFYPMIKPGVDFYSARYFADLSRLVPPHHQFAETNYDMYYISYENRKEPFFELEPLLDTALEQGHFKLYLQPKVELATGRVTSAEALVRWIDPQRGMIPLANFLPQMDDNGRIRELDLYLFDKACAYLEKWHSAHGKEFQISFNLSRAYFNGVFFMPEYTGVFEQYNLPPSAIRIELLESIVLNELEKLTPLVNDIYDYGFSCALDDFGSGFSNFDILIHERLSELKIDRSLFQNAENPKERFLIKHIVDIAHDMNMVAVAEGIETKDYARYLKEIGCDYIQGFYYYKPMPVEEFEDRFILKDESPVF